MTSSWGDHECKIVIYRFIIFGQVGSINMVPTLIFFLVVITITQAAFLTLDDCWGPNKKWTWDIKKKKHGLDSLSFGICVWDSTICPICHEIVPSLFTELNQIKTTQPLMHFVAFYLVGKQQHQNENVTVFMKQTGHLHAIVTEFRGLLCLCFAEHLHARRWCWQGLKFWNLGKARLVTATLNILNPWPDRWTSAYRRMRCYRRITWGAYTQISIFLGKWCPTRFRDKKWQNDGCVQQSKNPKTMCLFCCTQMFILYWSHWPLCPYRLTMIHVCFW